VVTLEEHINALQGPILVTGASGFVGSNLTQLILEKRRDVFAVVHKSNNWRLEELDSDNLVSLDFNDYAAVKNLIDKVSPGTVFDCAAFGAYSHETNSELIYKTNFLAKVNFIEQLLGRDVKAYIHAGSSSEYGTNCDAPVETSETNPNSDYSVSKIAFSKYLNYAAKQKNFPCLNLRLYSVYGRLEDTSRLIPNIVTHALSGTFPTLVDGEISRDFVHIEDVTAAFILAASKINPDLYGLNINIGTGNKTTISSLAEVVKEIFDLKVDPVFGNMKNRRWDLVDWYSNSNLAKDLIGWEPKVDLKAGLVKTADWIRSLKVTNNIATTNIKDPVSKRSLSAVVACYKDELAIPVMYERLKRAFEDLGIEYEIIFVNDGSPDNTQEAILKISAIDSNVVGIKHSRNFGSQMAFRSGMELSTKDAVVLLDGDLQDPPELIPKFYLKWLEGNDIIFGRRIKREMPRYLEFLYKLFYRTFAKFSYVKIPLDAGDFSLIDKRVVHWLLLSPERDLFLRGLRAYVGFKQVGVDYERPQRMFGKSTNSFIKNLDWAKKGILSFSNSPLIFLSTLGFISLITSVVGATITATIKFLNPSITIPGITSLTILVLILGSFNIFAVGIVGEYVARVLIEVKGRPRLIRESLTRYGTTIIDIPDYKQ
jgi:nucleoside-diphosphate-sugar epimerase/glycosyltransferase involved in cell wall biosynthesis